MAEIKTTEELKTLIDNYQKGYAADSQSPASPSDLDILVGGDSGETEPAEPVGVGLLGDLIRGNYRDTNFNNENQLAEAASRGWGQSRFDARLGYQSDRDLEDLRAREQSWFGKVGNGLLKGGVTTLTTALNSTVGLAWGLLRSPFRLEDGTGGIEEGLGGMVKSGANNEVSQFIIKLQNTMEEIAPNYRTEEERTDEYQKQFLKHIGTGNFIGDSFLKNFGFTLGSMAGGVAWNKVISRPFAKKLSSDLMKGAVTAAAEGNQADAKILQETAEAIRQSRNVGSVDTDIIMKNIKDAGKTIRNAQLTTQLFGATTAAMGEGTAEGLMAKNEFLEEFIPKMNADYANKYNSLEDELYVEHPEWFVDVWDKDTEGNPIQRHLLVSDEGKTELYNRQLVLSQKFQNTQAFAEAQGEALAKTTFLLNLPILMTSNLIQFGRLFGGGWTTARRNTPKVKGSLGNYKGTGSAKLRGALGAIKVAASEASEEMLQGIVSSGAKNVAETRSTFFNDMGYESKALGDPSDWVSMMVQGGKDYIGDVKNWQEGFLGAVTGLLGIPSRHLRTWSGGVVGEVNQAKAEAEASQKAADKLNELTRSEDFKNNWRGYVRHMAFDEQMKQAAEDGNQYAWHTADSNQLINDVLTFASAGRLEDLTAFVDNIANINPADNDTVDEIRKFLRSTNDTDNLTLASQTNESIVEKIKDQAEHMKNVINSYHSTFEDLANVVPGDVGTDRFKELMFTAMQLREFEDRFHSMLDNTISVLDPLFQRSSIRNKEGQVETDLDKVRDNLSQFQNEFREALGGNVGTSVMDFWTESYAESRLDKAEEVLENELKSLAGSARTKVQTAIDTLRDMRKVASDRRDFMRKLVNLRNMSNEQYDSEKKNEQKVLEKAEAEQLEKDTASINSVDGVRTEILKREEGQERNDYIESLKTVRGKNDAIDTYFNVDKLAKEIVKTGTPIVQRINAGSVRQAVTNILNYMAERAKSEEDILDMNPEIIPDMETALASIESMVTLKNTLYGEGARKSTYEDALHAVTDIINEVRENHKMTAAARVSANVTSEPEFVFDKPESEQNPNQVPEKKQPTRRKKINTVEEVGKKQTVEKKIRERKKKEVEAELKDSTPVSSPDAPASASEMKPADTPVVEVKNIPAVPSYALPEDVTTAEPEIPAAPIVAGSPVQSEELVQREAKVGVENANLINSDIEKVSYSGSKDKELDYYNCSVPEMSVSDTRGMRDAATLGRYEDINTLPYLTLPEMDEKYKDTWNTLNDKYNAFNNLDSIKPGDKVYFFIDPSLPKYDGEPQILTGTITKDGSKHIFNILRKNSDKISFRGLEQLRKDILDEYRAWEATEEAPIFQFSKSSKVWARRSGFIQFGNSVAEDTPINKKPGYNSEAPIVTIGTDLRLKVLRGSINTENIENSRFYKELIKALKTGKLLRTDVIGNVYYLANGNDNDFIPIRLNTEHYLPENAMRSGYGFNEVNKAISELVKLAKKFAKDTNKSLSNIDEGTFASDYLFAEEKSNILSNLHKEFNKKKSRILQGLGTFLDCHGIVITLGYTGDKFDIPTLRFSYYEDMFDDEGHWSRGEVHEPVDILADRITEEDLRNQFTSLARSFNISVEPSEIDRKHISDMADNGLFTSNAKTMRARGADVYIDSYNAKDHKFDSVHQVKHSPIRVSTTKTGDVIDTETVAESEQENTFDSKTTYSVPVTHFSEVNTGELKFADLSERQKNGLSSQGISEESFNSFDRNTQESLIRCFS